MHKGSEFIIERTDSATVKAQRAEAERLAAAGGSASAVVVAEGQIGLSAQQDLRASLGQLQQQVSASVNRRLDQAAEAIKTGPIRDRLAQARTMSGVAVKVSRALVTGAAAVVAQLSTQVSQAAAESETGQRFLARYFPKCVCA